MIQTREVSPTDGNGFSTAGIHEMQTTPPPGGEPVTHRVRAYTDAERGVVTEDTQPRDHKARFIRLAATDMIDTGRFEEAGIPAPWATDEVEDTGMGAWAKHYANEYGVDTDAAIEEARAKVAAIYASVETAGAPPIADIQASYAHSRP